MSVSPVLDSCGNPAILMFQKSFRNKRVVSKQGCCFERGEGGESLSQHTQDVLPPPPPPPS